MTEQNERDESSTSLEPGKNWDREDVFCAPQGAASTVPNDLQGILDQTKTQLSRTVQEFEAFRKRSKEERVKTILFCNEALVLDLLPILDDLDRSLAHLSNLPGDVGEGLGLVLQRFHKVLEKRNILTIDPVGKPFDPLRHEAVQVSEAAGMAPGTVVKTVQKGYLCSGRLLRPARVAITPVLRPEVATAPARPLVEVVVLPEPEPTPEPDFEMVPEITDRPPAKAAEKPVGKVVDLVPEKVNATSAGRSSEHTGNQSERSWVIDDDALADLEVALGEPISLPDTDAKVRSLS